MIRRPTGSTRMATLVSYTTRFRSLGELGRRDEGLAAIEEAVKIYRVLAEHHSDAYLPDLARSLNNLSFRLGKLGRRDEGLAIEEAVKIRREIGRAHV